MLDEYYESTVMMFATSQRSIGEQFSKKTRKMTCWLMVKLKTRNVFFDLEFSPNRNQIIEKYDLYTHYGIDSSESGSKAAMGLTYNNNVSANLTRFGSIEIRVLDTDPLIFKTWPMTLPNWPIVRPIE